jgi:hypothetical protein
LFRQVHFKTKAAMVSAMFLVPVLALGWSFYTDKAASIEFSAKERLGIEYVRDLMPLLKLSVQQRTLAGTPSAADMRSKVDAQLKVVGATEARLGAGLGTSPQFAKVTEAASKLATPAGNAEAAFDAHTRFIAAQLDVLGQATDGSNLILDPDLDTYYLMDLSTTRVPQLIELMARVQAAAAQALVAPSPGPPEPNWTTARLRPSRPWDRTRCGSGSLPWRATRSWCWTASAIPAPAASSAPWPTWPTPSQPEPACSPVRSRSTPVLPSGP